MVGGLLPPQHAHVVMAKSWRQLPPARKGSIEMMPRSRPWFVVLAVSHTQVPRQLGARRVHLARTSQGGGE